MSGRASRPNSAGGGNAQFERAQLKEFFQQNTPEACRDCSALSFLAMRLTTMSVSRGLPKAEALEEYQEAIANFCPRLGVKAVEQTCHVDDDYLETA